MPLEAILSSIEYLNEAKFQCFGVPLFYCMISGIRRLLVLRLFEPKHELSIVKS